MKQLGTMWFSIVRRPFFNAVLCDTKLRERVALTRREPSVSSDEPRDLNKERS